ncbi:hypothetical protein IID26_03500 [Patescibacteria group bacterium]|nr:hypothetical protein [Patescibacteria group bacterium]
MHRRSITAVLSLKKRIFWILIISIASLLIFYGYFVSHSIINVVLREEVEQELTRVTTRISDLEFQYLSKKDSINLAFAHSLGFQNVSQKQFVSRQSLLSQRLTLGEESL